MNNKTHSTVQEQHHPFFKEYYEAQAEKNRIAIRNVFGDENVLHISLEKVTPRFNESKYEYEEIYSGYAHDDHEIINSEGYYFQTIFFKHRDENGDLVYQDRVIKAVHFAPGQSYKLYVIKAKSR